MKYSRVELHNHTTHSDGSLTMQELIHFAQENSFNILALTDHNTTSGHKVAQEIIRNEAINLSLIYGIEVTTFFGHILALSINNMVDLTTLDPKKPELFFASMRRNGCKAIGIAHPFCIGSPISEGCRFSMTITNFDAIDYIEVANTSGPNEVLGNEKALAWWEELVLSGKRLAAVSGKDLHKIPKLDDVFLTYAIIGENDLECADAVVSAILSQKTLVTKGPLLNTSHDNKKIYVEFDETNNNLTHHFLHTKFDDGTELVVDTNLKDTIVIDVPNKAKTAIIKLYKSENKYIEFSNLVAIAPPVFLG